MSEGVPDVAPWQQCPACEETIPSDVHECPVCKLPAVQFDAMRAAMRDTMGYQMERLRSHIQGMFEVHVLRRIARLLDGLP